jgi:hypothetical protein
MPGIFLHRFARLILHHSPNSPTITLGPYTGDELSVDHIIPFSVAPQLDHVIANLELIPLRMNQGKRKKTSANSIYSNASERRVGYFEDGTLPLAGIVSCSA